MFNHSSKKHQRLLSNTVMEFDHLNTSVYLVTKPNIENNLVKKQYTLYNLKYRLFQIIITDH